MSKRTFLVLCLAVCLLPGGCTPSENAPETGGAPTRQGPPVAPGETPLGPSAGPSLSLSPQQPTVLDILDLQVSGATGPGVIRWEKNGKIVEGQTSARLGAEFFARGDVVTVVVATAHGEARAQTTIGNAPPRVTRVILPQPKVYRGVDLTTQVLGDDPDGDAVSYRYAWSVNGENLFWEDGPQLSGDKFRRGDRVVLQVTPFDGKVSGKPFKGVDLVIENAPPKFNSSPSQQFQGMSYHYAAHAVDPDGDRIIYGLETAPPGMAIDPDGGVINWTVDPKGAGDYKVRIVAEDGRGAADIQEFTLGLSFKQ